MTNEIVEQIRTMLKDEINPVYTRLDGIDNRLEQMDSRFDGIDNRLDQVDSRFENVEHEIKNLKNSQEQLQKNIITSIGEFSDRITEHFDAQTAALNKRVFANEANIERIMNQG